MQRFRFFFASLIAGGCLLTKQKIWAVFTQILVLVAGLEPARYLYRGILRHMRQKSTLTKTNKNRAFLAENPLKTPQNQ